MKFENALTGNWKNAFNGLRNPMNSWDKSDSTFGICQIYGDEAIEVTDAWITKLYPDLEKQSDEWCDKINEIDDWLFKNGLIQYNDEDDVMEYAFIGPNDMDLAQRMIAAGSPNDKFLRQIFVSIDITAPLYWWKEMDTYKVGTTANSTSTMHKLASTPITMDCFEMDDFSEIGPANKKSWEMILRICEELRILYNETKDIRYWKELIRILPESWLQTRTFTCNYGVLRNIIKWRSDHRLREWHKFVGFCKTLPYADELLFYKNNLIEN